MCLNGEFDAGNRALRGMLERVCIGGMMSAGCLLDSVGLLAVHVSGD